MTTKRRCAWPSCTAMVPASLWGCRDHWFKLPHSIRQKIVAHYRPGQELRGDASRMYLEAITEATRWIRSYGGAG